VRSKVKILAAIQASQPSVALGDAAGLPPLPSKEKLKRWYEVDTIESYFDEPQKQRLARAQEVVNREMFRLSLEPCTKEHLDRTLEYEVYVAGTNEVAQRRAQEAHELKRDAYADWQESSKFTPEDYDLRFKDATGIKFLKSKGATVPHTRRQLYQEIEDLDQEGWEQFFRDESWKRTQALFEIYRNRNADRTFNAVHNVIDETLEQLYDQTQEHKEYLNKTGSRG